MSGPEKVVNNQDPKKLMANDKILSIQHLDVRNTDDTDLAYCLLAGKCDTKVIFVCANKVAGDKQGERRCTRKARCVLFPFAPPLLRVSVRVVSEREYS